MGSTDTLQVEIVQNQFKIVSLKFTCGHLTLLSLVVRPLALLTKKGVWDFHFPRQFSLSFF